MKYNHSFKIILKCDKHQNSPTLVFKINVIYEYGKGKEKKGTCPNINYVHQLLAINVITFFFPCPNKTRLIRKL